MEIEKWPTNEMTPATSEAGGATKVVAVWSKSDLSTGTSEQSRLEADQWTTNTRNSAHHFAQITGRKAQRRSDGTQRRAQSTKQLEIFQARIPGGSVQVIRSRTSTTSFWRDSKIWQNDVINRNFESDATVDDDDHRPPFLAPLYWPASNDTIPLGQDTLPSFLTNCSTADNSTALYQPKIVRQPPSTPIYIRYMRGNENPITVENQNSEYAKPSCKVKTNFDPCDEIVNSNAPTDVESNEKWTNVEKRNRKVYLSSSPDLELRSTLAMKKLIEFIRVSVSDPVPTNADSTDNVTSDDRNSERRSPFEDNNEVPKNRDKEVETSLNATPIADPAEAKKNKKVEFSKTEVHFVAAEPGRIKIVETNEKPPPVSLYRRRRRNGDGRSGKKTVDPDRLQRPGARRENDDYSDEGDAKNLAERMDDDERMRKLVFAAASTFDKGLTVKISSTKDHHHGRSTESTSWQPTSLNRVTIKAGTSGYITKINFHPQGVTITDDVTTIVPGKRSQYLRGAVHAPIATIYLDKVSQFPSAESLGNEQQCKLPEEHARENGSSGNEGGQSSSHTTKVVRIKDEINARPDKKSSRTSRNGSKGHHRVTNQEGARLSESSSEHSTTGGGQAPIPGSVTSSTTVNRPDTRKRITRVRITKDAAANVTEICSDTNPTNSTNGQQHFDGDQNTVSTQRKSSTSASVEDFNEDQTAALATTTDIAKSSSENGHCSFPQAYESSNEITKNWRPNHARRNENVDSTARTHIKMETKSRGADLQQNKNERRSHQHSRHSKRSVSITSKSKPKRLIRQKCATARINIFNIQEKPQKLEGRTKVTAHTRPRHSTSDKPSFGTI